MVTNIEISGFTEELLDALVKAGIYGSKTEAIRDAVRKLLESYDMKDISLRAYRNGSVSFQLAAEISGLSMDGLMWYFLSRDTVPRLGSEDLAEVNQGRDFINEHNAVVFDLSSLYAIVELGLLALVQKVNKRLTVSAKTMERAKAFIMRISKMKGAPMLFTGIEVLSVNKALQEFARRNGISLQEAHAIYIAKKSKAVLLSDDVVTRQVARTHGVAACPSVSLLLFMLNNSIISDKEFKELISKMGTLPYMVPKDFIA